jgi:hypothetical protein
MTRLRSLLGGRNQVGDKVGAGRRPVWYAPSAPAWHHRHQCDAGRFGVIDAVICRLS